MGAGDETLQEYPEALPVGPVPADLPPVTGPQLYQMQFSTVEEHVQLIERAKALLAREKPGATLGELHFEAMKMLVGALEKRKFAMTERPRKPSATSAKHNRREPSEQPRQRGVAVVDRREASEPPRQRGRYIPAAERREVYRRDCGRCGHVDARGERCRETRYLELHHLQPFARHGANVAANLALRCRAHNQLAAEQDFGLALMAKKRHSLGHEALRAQIDANTKR